VIQSAAARIGGHPFVADEVDEEPEEDEEPADEPPDEEEEPPSAEPDPEPDRESEPEPDRESESDPDPEPDRESEPEPDRESDPDPELPSEPLSLDSPEPDAALAAALVPAPELPRSFFAHPDPLKWIAGAANCLRIEPSAPHDGQKCGPGSLIPCRMSAR
jgi:hypothetical protein